MKQCFQRALGFAKSEAVLSIAALLAVGSMAAVPPDKGYLDYIDWDTLALLFSLMAVSKGLQGQGVFDALGAGLLRRLSTTRQMLLVLTFLPFFVSMLVTNDVALITFVPFGLVVLEMAGCERLAIPLVVLQTAAANLGSMLTPMGNPQNLYLYNRSGMGFLEFCALLAPYAALSAAAIALLALLPKSEAMHAAVQPEGKGSGRRIALFAALGGVCLLCIAKLLPPLAATWAACIDRPHLTHTSEKRLLRLQQPFLRARGYCMALRAVRIHLAWSRGSTPRRGASFPSPGGHSWYPKNAEAYTPLPEVMERNAVG